MNEAIKRFITASIIGSLFWYIFFYLPPIAFSLLLFGILCAILIFEWSNFFRQNDPWFWYMMPIYLILPFTLLIYMNTDDCYRQLVYYLFIIVFSFDGTAYITGTLLGFHKIIPSISPGKTIEGCIGGFLGALVTFFVAAYTAGLRLSILFIITFVFITCCLAFVGDIFESFLKRKANIKDSGHILPGHGGFLDRFDAIIVVTFFFFIFRHSLAEILCKVM